jgi:hypothetical protein
VKELIAFLVYIAIWLGSGFMWIYAITCDAKADRIGWLLADILLPPIGLVRGLILFF